jgi:hypothetical protein
MKYLLIIMIALTGLTATQKKTLTGKYRIRFEKEYSSQNGIILFEKNTYTRKTANGKTVKGTIEYKGNAVTLLDENSDNKIEVSEKTIGKETVQFRTVPKDKAPEKPGEMIFYSGIMVKLK